MTITSENTLFVNEICTSYLLAYNKLPYKLAAQNNISYFIVSDVRNPRETELCGFNSESLMNVSRDCSHQKV